jgi:mono/diheme cytochrome c family protein
VTDPQMVVGQAIFTDTCSACHAGNGSGVERLFPRLAGNVVVKQDDPSSLVHIILTGARATGTDARPTSPAMPSLGYRLNDSQIAAVVTYIRNSWGNAASRVNADAVRTLRGRLSSAGN